MLRKILDRLSYANVTATLALFLTLGGAAYAAPRLAANSVGHTTIRKDAVRGPEIQKNAVRSVEVRDRAIKSIDIDEGVVPVVLSAVVSNDAKLVRGNGAGGVQEGQPGRYTVGFSRDVSSCTYSATVGDPAVAAEPDIGFAGVAGREGAPTGVSVVTRDRTGEVNGALDFHLVVVC